MGYVASDQKVLTICPFSGTARRHNRKNLARGSKTHALFDSSRFLAVRIDRGSPCEADKETSSPALKRLMIG